MVVSFDETFSRLLESNRHADVQLILDGRRLKFRTNRFRVYYNYLGAIQYGISCQIWTAAAKCQTIPINWFNPNLLYYWYNIPSLVATLSMLTCLIVTTLSVAREREIGTFDQLLVSPLVPFEILIGKIIPGIIIGTIEGSLMMARECSF